MAKVAVTYFTVSGIAKIRYSRNSMSAVYATQGPSLRSICGSAYCQTVVILNTCIL